MKFQHRQVPRPHPRATNRKVNLAARLNQSLNLVHPKTHLFYDSAVPFELMWGDRTHLIDHFFRNVQTKPTRSVLPSQCRTHRPHPDHRALETWSWATLPGIAQNQTLVQLWPHTSHQEKPTTNPTPPQRITSPTHSELKKTLSAGRGQAGKKAANTSVTV